MGVKSSKPCGSEASPYSSASSPSLGTGLKNKRRGKRSRVFQSSCLGSNSWCRRLRISEKICDTDDKARGSTQVNDGCSSKSEIQCVSSNLGLSNWNEPSASTSGEPSSPSSRMLPGFSFIPGNVSFKIGPNHPEPSRMITEPETQASSAVIKSISTGKTTTSQNQATTSTEPHPTRTIDPPITRSLTVTNPTVLPQDGFTHFDRTTRTREPTDGNARFSRSLSVGRLRDRVLRRTSSYSPSEQNREDIVNETVSHISTIPTQTSSLTREARYHNLLEHRSNFLERRRRIRSQRGGSRFENLSGRERSCILSGQHRTSNCTCRVSNSDETSAGVSISRIVLLAEALFEVLDEIHQQSVVLTARNPVSSFGSLPAPWEAVEALPVKAYSKKGGNEEAAQCYICLVEYEEGDEMRVLPCKHEFHRSCVDKWLKDIHRICPLCRGDICALSV